MPDGDLLSVSDLSVSPSWRDVLPVHPAAETVPSIKGDDFERLKADIALHGLQVPVVLVRENEVDLLLDGRSRLDAMEAVGRKTIDAKGRLVASFEIFEPSKKQTPLAYVRSLNLHRRHLRASQIRTAIEAELKRDPGQSDRAIAKGLGVDHKTVAKAREEAENRGEVGNLPTSSDARGGVQPRRKRSTAELEADIKAELQSDPSRSNTAIAKAIGAAPARVASVRSEIAEPVSEIEPEAAATPACAVEVYAPAPVDIFDPLEGIAAELRNLVLGAMGDLPFSDWPRLIARLRDEIDDVENDLAGHESRMRADGKPE